MNLILLCSLMTAVPPAAEPLDTLTLLDGEVLSGYIESQTERFVLFRVSKNNGKITYLRRVPTRHILELHRVDRPSAPPQPPVRPAPAKPPALAAESEPAAIKNQKAYFQSIVAEWEVRNLESASLRLVRLINDATPEELVDLEAACLQRLDQSLPDFAAEVHIAYALQRAENGYFRLYFVMPFHLEQLHRRMTRLLQETLTELVRIADPADPESPATRFDAIVRWLPKPERYDGYGFEAEIFSRQITTALGMNRELVRLGRALHVDDKQLKALHTQHGRLRKLLRVANRNRERSRSRR